MIGSGVRLPVYAYTRPCDLRKGFDGLVALARDELRQSPVSGALFLFTNARRTTAKVLYWDGTGLCILSKRLARGRFAALWRHGTDNVLTLSRPELELFLQGCEVVGKITLMPPPHPGISARTSCPMP
jgi:transposase